mgnify:CR=1 FL=1
MKRFLALALAVVLLLSAAPFYAIPAVADSQANDPFWGAVFLLDPDTAEPVGYVFGVGVTIGSEQYVISMEADTSKYVLVFKSLTAGDDKAYLMSTVGKTSDKLLLSLVDDAQTGRVFPTMGTLKKGDKVEVRTVIEDSEESIRRGSGEAVAKSLSEGWLTLDKTFEMSYAPVWLLNEKGELVGIGDGENFLSTVSEDIFNGGSETKPTEEPTTEPPATEAPATESPATEAPATEPPATQAPANSGSSGGSQSGKVDLNKKIELPELHVNEKEGKLNKVGSTALVAELAAAVALAAAVVVVLILYFRKKKKSQQVIHTEVEEGTQLNDWMDSDLVLRCVSGVLAGRQFSVGEKMTIGRAPDNTLVVPPRASTVSGHHCALQVHNGKTYICDLGSTNGTYLNGRRLQPGAAVELVPGMQLTIGSIQSGERFLID